MAALCLTLAALAPFASALPSIQVPEWAHTEVRPCQSQLCAPPTKKYSLVQAVTPRLQWGDAGGYCGSMSIQEIALGRGVWLSQQQVRDHTIDGGGNDHEILETNIALALKDLKLNFEAFDYKGTPTPQADAYRTWIKGQLSQGHGLVWMIMLRGGQYPVYPALSPYGFYSHVEPVYGIFSDQPLNDTKWYDDDYLAHSTDASQLTYYRRFDSLVADVNAQNVSQCGHEYLGYPCIYQKWGFGWAISGVADARDGMPLSLAVDRPDEPDTRKGEKPAPMHGTVTVTELVVGQAYDIFRWDSVETAFDYAKGTNIHSFTASAESIVFDDPQSFMSDSATYYRCVLAA